MQAITITGGLGRDAELKTTQSGDDILSFSVGSSQGYGDKKTTNWFRCTVWGKRGRSIAQYLTKGTKVTVQGELSIGSYDGKPQFDVRVNEVEWQRSEGAGGGTKAPPATDSAWDQTDDLDDSVPFITCSPSRERRVM
jgi:single-strand DNA-binding protein